MRRFDPKPTWDPDPCVRVRKEYNFLRRYLHKMRSEDWLEHYRWPERVERQHVHLFRKVSEVLFEWDLIKVRDALGYGFDVTDIFDEYDPEAASLVFLMDQCNFPDQMERILVEVVESWFCELAEPDEYYTLVARDLWNTWMRFQGLPPHIFPDDIHLPPRQQPIVILIDSKEDDSDVPPQGVG